MSSSISHDNSSNMAGSQDRLHPEPAFLEESETVGPLFDNPFRIEDLLVFDDATFVRVLEGHVFGTNMELLAHSLQGASRKLIKRILYNLQSEERQRFLQELYQLVSSEEQACARKQVLDLLFWELTYWKTPELYEELTEGEWLHPGIFEQLEPDLQGKVVLDAGAGSGRATFQSLRHGAAKVYAVEPSPGLLHILENKLKGHPAEQQVIPMQGCFSRLPLETDAMDLSLSCSAFTSEEEHGGEDGLEELKRVTKSGGKIILIWPRPEDREWFIQHGFEYVTLPVHQEMHVHFRSLPAALRCAERFYARNQALRHYLIKKQTPEVPFSVLGINPPLDYCWLKLEK
ncbi:MAG TPA: methyltransferase domain-containing protein [Ktedonobacteraceae bacterium]|nr:methyltransferase domain-containing protein [Ktedonobacteraceae bacterium]